MHILILFTLTFLGFADAVPTKLTSKGFVSIDITAEKSTSQDSLFTLLKRGPEVFFENDLSNNIIYYSAQVGVGTPAQNFSVIVDTGSSDFWIAGSSQLGPVYFNSSLSSTYHSNNTVFAMQYVKGSNTGTWSTDNVSLGQVSVSNLPFGLVNNGADLGGTLGVMGIGAMKNEAPLVLQTGPMYPNFPQKLKNQGHIHKVAYSMFLNDLNATSGSLLFGGVDRTKFTGPLYTVPIVGEKSLEVELSSIGVSGTNLTHWTSSPITLDSGTSFTYLPPETVVNIGDSVKGAKFIGGLYFIDSTKFDWTQYVEFNFSGASIKVPVKSFSLKTSDVINPGTNLNPKYDYVLGLLSNVKSRGINLLGDTFLRSAYIVFDLEDWQVSMAPAGYQKTNSDIYPIISSIPFAIKAPTQI